MSTTTTPPPRLHAFIYDNLEELIARVRTRAGDRTPAPTAAEDEGLGLLFARIITLLKNSKAGTESGGRPGVNELLRGQELFAQGLSIAQVVHGYGDIGQVVTELANERSLRIAAADFRALNSCLEGAIAQAVTEYSRLHDRLLVRDGAERLGALAHELRNVISTAMLSFDAIKRGAAGTHGSVSGMHTRSLARLRDLVDRAFTEVRLDADLIRPAPVVVSEFIEEAEIAALFQARAHNLDLFVLKVEPDVSVNVDRNALSGALANLLQNAFKFSRPGSFISLVTRATETRVCIDVQDECGGLPAGKLEQLFTPFDQRSQNRTGLGLGLSIARRAVEASEGELRVVDLPQLGCRFTIDLPAASRLHNHCIVMQPAAGSGLRSRPFDITARARPIGAQRLAKRIVGNLASGLICNADARHRRPEIESANSGRGSL